jgi:hypothetical protein
MEVVWIVDENTDAEAVPSQGASRTARQLWGFAVSIARGLEMPAALVARARRDDRVGPGFGGRAEVPCQGREDRFCPSGRCTLGHLIS